MGLITDNIGKPAALENFAEECIECAKEALKLARIIRRENPTDSTAKETQDNLREEFTDVMHMAMDLGLKADKRQIIAKNERFIRRMGSRLK